MSFYDPWTLGMTLLPTAPQPLWAFDARSAGGKAFNAAARRGDSPEACQAAWQATYDKVANA